MNFYVNKQNAAFQNRLQLALFCPGKESKLPLKILGWNKWKKNRKQDVTREWRDLLTWRVCTRQQTTWLLHPQVDNISLNNFCTVKLFYSYRFHTMTNSHDESSWFLIIIDKLHWSNSAVTSFRKLSGRSVQCTTKTITLYLKT